MEAVPAALAAAKTCWEAGDAAGALRALLDAWRGLRNTRIAALIDRVSERLLPERGPIAGKTVKARTEAWLARAARLDPADVGGLLATPWPGMWKDARPVASALSRFPDDPRIAMALARVVEQAPWESWGSRLFYWDVLPQIERIADERTVPLLAAVLGRKLDSSWEQGTRASVASVHAKVAHRVTADKERGFATPSADVEAALAALEGLFAEEAATDAAEERGEADFLRAVYAEPDDDALRMVFADWLTERGDPRGELISLQLAVAQGRATADSRKRERTLLNKHRTAWLGGALDRVLAENGRLFARGFLDHAEFDIPNYPKALPPDFADPALATVRTVEVAWSVTYAKLATAIARVPVLAHATALRAFDAAAIFELADDDTPRPRIASIDLLANQHGAFDPVQFRERIDLLARPTAFPNLRALGTDGALSVAELVLTGELAPRLERYTLHAEADQLGPLLRLAERTRSPVRELALACGWLLILRRDASGRFCTLEATTTTDVPELPDSRGLRVALGSLAPEDLSELRVDGTRTCELQEAELRGLEDHLARFTRLTRVDVPWERLDRAGPRGTPLHLTISHRLDRTTDELAKLWALCAEPPLGLTFDSYSVNGGKHLSLPADGLAHATAMLAKPRSQTAAFYRKASGDTCQLSVDYGSVCISSALGEGDAFLDHYLDWVERARALLASDHAAVPFAGAPYPMLRALGRYLRWLDVLPAEVDRTLPFEALLELVRAPEHAWVRARRIGTSLALVFGPTPASLPPAAQLEAFELEAIAAIWRAHGFDPHALAAATLGPALERAGFVPDPGATATALGLLRYRRVRERAEEIDIWSERPPEARLVVRLRDAGPPERWDWVRGDTSSAGTLAEAEASLAAIAARIETQILPWFEPVPPPPVRTAGGRRGKRT